MTTEELLEGKVLVIDKPYGWTSFQAVNKVKSVIRRTTGLKKFKIGHAGTLDPLATGLLLVCVGKCTKEIPTLQDGEKIYTGTMVLGATTPCYDMEQEIDKCYPTEHITQELIESARQKFIGNIPQVPPMFSAVKIDGQRAYEYARKDDPTIRIEPRNITIHEFELSNLRPAENTGKTSQTKENEDQPKLHLYDHPQGFIPEGTLMVDFKVRCGKGTYIRSLARDFGSEIQSGAFLSALRRERVGKFTIHDAMTLEQTEQFFMENFPNHENEQPLT